MGYPSALRLMGGEPRRGGILVLGVLAALCVPLGDANAAEPALAPVPPADCGPGSRPETGIQGRVSAADHASGRAAKGFTCNTRLVGSFTTPNGQGTYGGFKVERYVDAAGHDCAFYDTTLLFPTDLDDAMAGVNVLDMSDPTKPTLTATLATPAMLTPHESLVLNQKRGLLAAVAGSPGTNVGILDLYDVSQDCRHPVLRSTSPVGILGHESGMAPDGRTFYSASPGTSTVVAVDISNPSLPLPLWIGNYDSHGLSISDDGKRAYLAGVNSGLIVLDTSQIQARVPNPTVREVSRLKWKSMSIPQNAIPVTIKGHRYVVEIDEFGAQSEVGAGRIIDIGDETRPRVVSNLRLAVHQPQSFAAQAGDPGATNPIQGYAGHYCNVPRRTDPGIVACSMILSGMRVFDIRDPLRPREIAYFNAPVPPRAVSDASNYAMSSPSFVPERGEIWYSDGFSGFYAIRVTNSVWPFAEPATGPSAGSPRPSTTTTSPAAPAGTQSTPGTGTQPASGSDGDGGSGGLPLTGLELLALVLTGLLLLGGGLALRHSTRGR
ncbi:MAG: LVIVD repeat-containing protein [Solirubrobacteraceae bacterium]